MEFGTNKSTLKMLTCFLAIIIMIGTYYLASYIYKSVFVVSSHSNVGMIFVSFFFLLIASPILLLAVFAPVKYGLTAFVLGFIYLFIEWFSVHPLRVVLMGGGGLIGFVFEIIMKKYILSRDTGRG